MRSPSTVSRADLAYAITFAGAIGSAAIAGFFLLLDTFAGQPLATPMFVGSALLEGATFPTAELRLDILALYSLIHLAMFAVVGAVFALLAARLEGRSHAPAILSASLFATLTAGIALLDLAIAPSLVDEIGLGAIVMGNVIAAGAMTLFYANVFRLAGEPLSIPSTLIGE